MKLYPFPDRKISRVLFPVMMFVFLLIARDTLMTSCILGFYETQFLTLGLMILMGAGFLLGNRHRLKEIFADPRMLLIGVSCAVILIPMLIKRDWQLMYFSVLLFILFGIFVSYFADLRKISRDYVLILTGLCLYSLITVVVLCPLAGNGVLPVPVFNNSMDVEFYNFGLCFLTTHVAKNRNFGIFREPGVYQYFILLGVYLNNYTVEWKKNWQMWAVNAILAVTMLTTFATGGVIELGLMAIVIFFDKKWYRSKAIRITAILLIAALALLVYILAALKSPIYWELVAMLTKLINHSPSAGSRVESILVDAWAFFRHPLFGGQLAETIHAVENNTTSTMLMFALFGVAAGCLHTVSWIALVWEKDRKLWANLALLMIFFMSFNTENIIDDMFFWLLPMMALVQKGMPLLKRKKSSGCADEKS